MSHLEERVLTASVSTGDTVPVTHGLATGNDIDLSIYLDASRIQTLRRLFDIPGQQGIDIFSRLLSYALLKDAPDELRDSESQYAALLSIESLHVLSHLLKYSYETTTKYVTLFLTCGFLEKHKVKHSRRVYLAIPKGPYTPSPTLLANLDTLLARPASRPKVKALVRQVRDRLYAYDYVTVKELEPGEDFPISLQHILTVLQSERVDSTQRISLAVGMLTKLIVTVTKTSTNLVDAGISSHPVSLPIHTASIASTSKVDANTLEQEGRGLTAVKSTSLVDARTITHNESVVASTREVDASHLQDATSPSQVDANHQLDTEISVESTSEVDANHSQATQKELFSTPQVDATASKQEKVVDSSQNGYVNAPYTYNVNFIISNIKNGDNVIRKRIAQFLAGELEEQEYDNGYPTFSKYLKAFQRYSPEVIGRAFLATMFLFHRKHWKAKRGATFTNQCKILSGQLPLAHYTLDDVENWLQAWGNLPYSELIDVLATPPPTEQPTEPAGLIAAPRQASHSGPAPLPAKKKRTYGSQFTGLPSGRKGFNTAGSALPPENFNTDTHKEKKQV